MALHPDFPDSPDTLTYRWKRINHNQHRQTMTQETLTQAYSLLQSGDSPGAHRPTTTGASVMPPWGSTRGQ